MSVFLQKKLGDLLEGFMLFYIHPSDFLTSPFVSMIIIQKLVLSNINVENNIILHTLF